MSKKEKKLNNGIEDLRFVASLAVILGLIVVGLNLWNGIKVSVDTYVENQNNNIIEYTKNFIETEKDENINIEDVQFIETNKDANMYMLSYISDSALAVIINVLFVFAYYQLVKFFSKENMENPFDGKAVNCLKKSIKFINVAFGTWLIGGGLLAVIFILAPACYASTAGFDLIMYVLLLTFIQFIIHILEKGQLKENLN